MADSRQVRLVVAFLGILSLIAPSLAQNAPRVMAAGSHPTRIVRFAHTRQSTPADVGQPTGLPITFTSTGSCSVSGSTVTLTAAGSCTITAHQDGNDTYNPAAPVSQTFQIAKAATTVSVSAPSTPYDDPVTLSAQVSPASLAGQTLTGTVQFAIDGTSVGSAPIDSTGLATNAPLTITQPPGTYTVTASFTSSNPSFQDSSGSTPLAVTKEDTTLSYSGDTTGDYNDAVTLKSTLLEDGDASKPLANQPVTFSLGNQSCTGSTGSDGTASCTITPKQAAGSSYTASASFAGDGNYQNSSDSKPFTIKPEETSISYTGPTLIAQGRSATLSAALKEDGTTAIAGEALTLTLGSGSSAQSCTTGPTDATGTASCTISSVNQPFGQQPVTASFAGDQDYQPASDTSHQALLFGYLASGSFVLGDTTTSSALTSGSSVTWWGAQWSSLNTLSGGAAPDSFKGFAATTSATPPVCGGSWTTDPGNSSDPPGSVPPYMAVIVSSTVTKAGSKISGDIQQMVIVKTDAGYAGDPGHAGTGTVVAVLCTTTPGVTGSLSLVSTILSATARAITAQEEESSHLPRHASVGNHQLGGQIRPGKGRPWSDVTRPSRSSAPRLSAGPARAGTSHAPSRALTGLTRPRSSFSHHHSAPVIGTRSHFRRHLLANASGKLDQKIIFDSLRDKTFGDPPFQVSATSVALSTPAVQPIEPISTTTVQGNFFPESASAQSFVAKSGDTPAFQQSFPTMNFNPPDKVVPHNISGVGPQTRPFTDITTDLAGNYAGTLVAQGNGTQAGVGDLSSFDTVFTASFTVAKPGDVTFNIIADDGFILGVGGGATRVSGAYESFPQPGTSPFQGYTVVGAFDQAGASSPGTYTETVHFPSAGTYPYELDYFERNPSSSTQQLSLVMTLATFTPTTTPLSVYTGYADGLRPAGSVFPFPWQGSAGVVYVGGGCCDNGAMRFDNNTGAAITLDSVTVDIGGAHYDIWPRNIQIPAHGIGILTGTSGENFDSSDVNGTPCQVNSGLIPQIHVSIGGVVTTYADTPQVLNTRGFDSVCLGNESTSWTLIGGNASTIDVPLPPTASLLITPATVSADTVGQQQTFTVAAMDAAGKPIAGLSVTLGVYGANTQQLSGSTDAAISYMGTNAGTDTVTATAFIGGMRVASNGISVPWSIPTPGGSSSGGTPAQAPPAITNLSPADGSIVAKLVPISASFTPPQGETISSWQVTYQALDPEPPVTVASGTGAPPATLATFDPTLLPNDTYAITISATASGGGTQTLTTTVAVSGNLKLGHYVTTFQDLSVPVNGFQMEVQRTYDSYDKRVGDFGVGWRVDLSNFRVSANRQLGAGGWTEYPTQCILGLCYWGFKTSAPHYVTVTWPDGHQEVFDFTPKGGAAVFYWEGQAAFTARPGTDTTSTLEVDGDTGINYGFDGNIDAGDGSPYNPTRFQLTTHDGRVLILDVHSGLVSETDRSGNSLTVDSTGVHASNGESITYTRDGQNRITAISGPSGQSLSYTYDGNGDLSSSTDPDGNATTYAYTGDHLLTSITGPGQTRPFQQEVYDAATGRLTEVIDGDGNVTKVSNDVGARQQVVTDPAGKLTTVYSYDDLGDLIQRDQNFGGKTLTDTYTYDADGRPLSHTDPLGHTWAGVYDSAGDLTQVTSPASHSIAVSYDRFGNPLSVANPLGGNTSFSYDASGNLTGFTDALGHTETYSYDSAGNEVGRKDAAGNPWSGTYDSAGNLVSETDPLGHTTTYTYGVTGHMTSATDAHGNKTTYTYDAEGNLLSETDPLGHTTRWSYDSLGQVISKTDADGSITTYAYDGAGHLISTKDPLGHTTTNTYDADGRLASTTDPAGGVTSSTYDGAGRLATKTDPVGRITSYQYDDAGHLIKTTLPNGGTDTVTYDSEGHRVSETDAMGRTTSYSYDANGRLTGVTDPLGHKTTYQFDAIGQPVSITDALGQTTTQSFDALGRLVSVTDPTNGTATTMYDVAGRIVATKDALGRTTTFTYDSADRLVSTTDPAGHTTSYAYDAAGNQTSETDALGNTTTYTYDAMGRQVGVTDPLGHTTTTTYDGAGRQTSQTDARGATTHYAYDAAGNLTGLTDALGGTVSSTYDAAEQRTTLTDPLGRATHFTYDALGNVASETDPLGRITTSTYDLDGELTSRTDGRGDTATSSYDAAGHLTSTSSPGFSATYAYDALGRRTSMTGPSGTTTYIYDADGRVTTDASPQGTITYSYDAAGQRTEMTLPGARTITYTHDAASNLTGLADWAGHSVSFGYDANGRPTSITRPNGVTTSYGYDAAGNIVTLDHDGPGGPLGHYAYTYDAANNRTSVSSAAGTETYTLDALGRLIGVTYPGGHTSSYTYDDAGNRTSATVGGTTTNATYDAAGELTSNGGTAYTYDGAGNLLTAGTSSFTWDGAGHLTNATVGGTASTYTYNGDGLRVSATTGGATTPYLWDSQDGMPALVDDGTNSYLQASGVQAQVDRSNAATYALDDALGSVRTLTDAAGTQVGAASYDAFGAVRSQTGTASIFGFTGQQTDPTGLLYLRARYLDPQLGQFLSADMLQPSGPGTQGYNRYTYVGDNPTTAVDPSGHGALIERALLSGVVGAGIGAGVGAILCQHGATYSKCVLRNTLLGLVSGLAGGLVPVGGFAGACAAGAVGSGTAAAVGGLADGNLDLGDVAKQAAIGCGIGGVTYGAGKAVFGKTPTEPKEPEPSTGEPSSPGGSLTIIGNSAQYSASEIRSAQYLRSQGYDVVLRPPTGIRAGGNTSDLLVNDKQYDVYTPVTTNVRNIISNIAAKGTQVHGGGVVVDLSESTLPASALQDVLAQVQEETSRVSDVIVIPPAGAP